MHPEVERVIEQVSKEKGISKELVIDAVEDSMRSAARKQIGMQFNIEVKFNPEVKELEVFKVWKVVPIVNDPFTEITLEDARRGSETRMADPEAEFDDELLE